jgi:hypothetical protein
MRCVFLVLYVFTGVTLGCNNTDLDVNSTEGISARFLLKDNDSLSVLLLDDGGILSTEYIDVSSEKKNHITFEDYNRDGYKDFSVWHLDEGMGVYKIYRLFIFTPAEKKFKEIKPTCGDDFLNIRTEGENLINVLYDDNAPKSCVIPLKNLK